MMLERLQKALAALGKAYRYVAEPNAQPPYLVWGEDSSADLEADNIHSETGWGGTIDLYTRDENDPLAASVPAVLNELEAAWYLTSVQYESDTGLVHFEWAWEMA